MSELTCIFVRSVVKIGKRMIPILSIMESFDSCLKEFITPTQTNRSVDSVPMEYWSLSVAHSPGSLLR